MNASQTALLLRVPGAERAVSRHRRMLDSAAADGIPAHVTVLFPFVPLEQMSDEDHARLDRLFAALDPIRIRGRRTSWFGGRVLFVELEEDGPIRAMTENVFSEFPWFPPYAGEIAVQDVVPHLTVGHDSPVSDLRAAEHEVLRELPFEDMADHVELWAGPAVSGRSKPAPWRHIRSYELDGRR